MATDHNLTPITTDAGRRPRRRFSDKLEYRRGQNDARAGRPPASIHARYMAGYAEGRRQARQAKINPSAAPRP